MAEVKFEKVYTMRIPHDLNEGRGGESNEGFFTLKEDAVKAAQTRGVMGTPAPVGELDLVRIDGVCYQLASTKPVVVIDNCSSRLSKFISSVKVGDEVEIQATKNGQYIRDSVTAIMPLNRLHFSDSKSVSLNGSEPILRIIKSTDF